MPFELSAEQLAMLTQLRSAERRTLKVLFQQFEPPQLPQIDGEYAAELLCQGNSLVERVVRRVFGLYGNWQGKAFQACNEEQGVGYNYFLSDAQGISSRLYMDTYIQKSSFTEGSAMHIDYRRRNRGPICLLRGEVRQARPGILLGFGCFGIRLGKKDRWRRKIPFVMYGPTHPFRQGLAA